ncbi:serine/threonine protein kinase [Streptomyces camponoticapitis]|uniref:Serine/threonine protein kinase n=1 Tax=Streptomyces camponoticapitis TaxID=1616125 RepID=A0ABQ2DZM4_9ACTN|nr:protein kinase family protein [Streptomyces camponoticapitis]GGJ82341.1 serine/threonine protein kinase [Streptomyces camponoticapitis]
MAERSTAAVEVADNSGDEPPAAQADEATTDGVAKAQKTEDGEAAESGSEETAGSAARKPAESGSGDSAARDDGKRQEARQAVTAPELHSGHKLAGRYRLEECVTRLDGFSSWRAVDEKLRRAVGVHLLPADHPRARSVLAAARSSALLGDPRFVQVLDAVEENDLVYVVHEWLPDATELTAILAAGPMEAHDAYQLVSQVSQAMAAAHREGLAHLKLTPSAVLRSSTGQYRIRGLAVNAALRGISAERPQRADTEAIGALLYAALTQRWPYETDAYGLAGLPKGVGLIAPDQVRAGVHRGLSELAMRALVNEGATASRQDPPCTTPDELAKAVAEMPRVRPPEPTFAAPPEYQRTTYQQGSYARPATRPVGQPPAQPVPVPPPPLQSRTGKALKWTVSALLIAALGLASWQVADHMLNRKSAEDTTQSQSADGTQEKPEPRTPKKLKIAGASAFAPDGDGVQAQDVPLATDGDTNTAWITGTYKGYANYGNLPNRRGGSGIVVDLGSVRDVYGVDVAMYRAGQKAQVLAAGKDASAPAALADFSQRITELGQTDSNLKATLDKPVRTRYVLIHITELAPADSANEFRGGISEIKVIG